MQITQDIQLFGQWTTILNVILFLSIVIASGVLVTLLNMRLTKPKPTTDIYEPEKHEVR